MIQFFLFLGMLMALDYDWTDQNNHYTILLLALNFYAEIPGLNILVDNT